jgi:hypothetical protein
VTAAAASFQLVFGCLLAPSDRKGTTKGIRISPVCRLDFGGKLGLTELEVGLDERLIKDDNVVGLHGESGREVLFVQRFDADEDYAHATLLRLAYPLAQILVATDEVGS